MSPKRNRPFGPTLDQSVRRCDAQTHTLSHIDHQVMVVPFVAPTLFRYSCRRAFGWYPSRCLGGINISECAPPNSSPAGLRGQNEPRGTTMQHPRCLLGGPHVMLPSTAPQCVAVRFLLIFISKSSPVETHMEIIAGNQAKLPSRPLRSAFLSDGNP